MINKKGQALVAFVIILPIIFLLLGMVIEFSLIAYHKSKITSVTKSIIANSIEDAQKDDIIMLYDKNGIDVIKLDLITGDGLSIDLEANVDSFLGDIVGKNNYKIKIKIHGYQKDNKVYYEKG